MSTTTAKTRAVDVWISDPWEFGTECGEGPFGAVITDQTTNEFLLRLEVPLLYQGRQLTNAIARPRHTGDNVAMLSLSARLDVGLLFVERSMQSLSDVSNKESGVPAIGSVRSR
jgi:hypothetical protein